MDIYNPYVHMDLQSKYTYLQEIYITVFMVDETLCQTQSQQIAVYISYRSLLPMFSSKNFMVLGFRFKSLNHFELIFEYGERQWYSFFLLHVAVQFFQH